MAAKWEVAHWIEHTIPGRPSPVKKASSTYRWRWRAWWAYVCMRMWDHETSCGRGVYYTTMTPIRKELKK